MSYTLQYTGAEIDSILGRSAPGGQLDTDIAAKAPLASPALTGNPTAPTQDENDNSTKLATTAYADRAAGDAASAAYPTDSVSGDVVSFSDGADGIPVKSFAGSIVPVQDLHGQSAPYPAGGGKNKLNPANTIIGKSISNAGAIVTNANCAIASDFIGIGSNTSVALSAKTAVAMYIACYDSNQEFISRFDAASTTSHVFTLAANTAYVKWMINYGAVVTQTIIDGLDLQLEMGDTVTTFAPYSNICPISGWAGANITRAGRNLFNPHPNHNVSAQGEYIAAGAQYWATDYIPIGNTKTVVVSVADLGGMTDGSIVRVAYASDGTVSAVNVGYFDHYTTPWTFTLADNIVGLRFRGYRSGGASPITGAKIQVEFGTTASTYEAYQGDTILLDFSETVYAGTLTALGGGLWSVQPTHAALTLNGSESWAAYASGNGYRLSVSGMASGEAQTGWADWLATVPNLTSLGIEFGRNDTRIYAAQANTIPSVTDLASWQAYLGTHPLTILYPLATLPDPIIVSGDDLATILGANTVWQSCGSVTEMTYRADTALYIQKLLNGGGSLSLSMTAPSPSLSLGRVGVLAEPEEAEPEQTEETEQLEQTEEPEQTEEAEEE